MMFNNLLNRKQEKLYAPVDGVCIPLETINDQVFSSKMMGDGIAFQFKENTIYSPVNGEVTMVFPTKHAYGIRTKNGAEILLHVGMNTVELNGKGFTSLVKQGDKVRVHQPLVRLEQKVFIENNIDLTTPLIITNSTDITYAFSYTNGEVEAGKTILGSLGD